MKIKEGEQLPNSEFYYLDSSGAAKKITTAEVFKNHKTIVIGVPGAFTKVCSAKHLPGYVNNYEEAKNKGITKIICVAVNDPNVMKACFHHIWIINGDTNNFCNPFVLCFLIIINIPRQMFCRANFCKCSRNTNHNCFMIFKNFCCSYFFCCST